MADFLDEDISISSQKYCVISYTLPDSNKDDTKGKKRVGWDTPMIKIRGSYSTQEECESRIEKLKISDTYFHMYICHVGVWGPLLNEEQLKESGTSFVHMNKDMNDFMKDYKEGQDRKNAEFEDRRKTLAEKARFEGTKEGQEELAKQRESPISVNSRIQNLKTQISNLEKDLAEARKLLAKSEKTYSEFTREEIDIANKDLEALKIQEIQE
jgi:hypothetical protein